MKVSRFSDAQLAQLAARYRSNADESQKMSWPKNAEEYCKRQIDIAEMLEELLARRRGEA